MRQQNAAKAPRKRLGGHAKGPLASSASYPDTPRAGLPSLPVISGPCLIDQTRREGSLTIHARAPLASPSLSSSQAQPICPLALPSLAQGVEELPEERPVQPVGHGRRHLWGHRPVKPRAPISPPEWRGATESSSSPYKRSASLPRPSPLPGPESLQDARASSAPAPGVGTA